MRQPNIHSPTSNTWMMGNNDGYFVHLWANSLPNARLMSQFDGQSMDIFKERELIIFQPK